MTATPEPHLTNLARGGLLSLVGACVTAVSGVALVAIVASGYPPGVAGAFFAATSVFLILGAACELGSDIGLVRWLPRYLAQGCLVDARRCVSLAGGPVLVASCVAAAGMFLAAPWIAALTTGGAALDHVSAMLRVLAGFLPVAAVRNLLLAATRGHGSIRPTVVIERWGRNSAQVAGVAAALIVGGGPLALAVAWGLPYLLGLVAAAWWYVSIVQSHRPEASATPPARRDGEIRSEFWRFTRPRAVAHVCQVALQRTDIVLVAALRSPQEAAIYTVATRFILIGQLASYAVQQVMQPALSRLLARGERASVEWVFRMATTWIAALATPLYAFVTVAAPLYLTLVGDRYALEGHAAVVILAAAMMVATVSGPVDGVLLMAGRSGLSLANNAVALTLNLGLNAVLIPWLGVTGAAVSWAGAIVARNVLPLVQVRSLLRLSPFGPGAWWVIGSGLLCFGLLPVAVRLFVGLDPALFAGLLLPCATAYGGLLWLARSRIAPASLVALLGRRSHTRSAAARSEC